MPREPVIGGPAGLTTRAELRALGVRPRLDRWHRLRRARYVERDHFARLRAHERLVAETAAAVSRLTGDAAASHETAATLHGLPALGLRHVRSVHVTRTRRHQGLTPLPGLLVHHAGLPDDHLCLVEGVATTSVARTVADIARRRSFRAGVVVADAALHLGLCTHDEIMRVLDDCHGWPGTAKARSVVRFADARCESPLESISRVAFTQRGLPPPELQVRIGDDRVDFLWRRWSVVGEADGLEKYTGLAAVVREKDREERLRARRYEIVRWMWTEAYRRPDVVADRVWVALARAGWRP